MKTLLRTEELAEALLALVVFARLPYAWWVLPATFLLPDLSMASYLAGSRGGLVLQLRPPQGGSGEAAGWWLGQPGLLLAGTVLLFHSAVDGCRAMASSTRPAFRTRTWATRARQATSRDLPR